MFWKNKSSSAKASEDKKNDNEGETQKMGMLQRLAMKKIMAMSPEEQKKLMEKALTPENISKNKDKILAAMEQMKASGQMTDEQIKEAKEKLFKMTK
jgi:hypothetical protein